MKKPFISKNRRNWPSRGCVKGNGQWFIASDGADSRVDNGADLRGIGAELRAGYGCPQIEELPQ
jgi:hypothetical protein